MGPQTKAKAPLSGGPDKAIDRHDTLEVLGLDGVELRRYADFRGLNLWSGKSRNGTTCLLVAVPGQGLRDGLSAEGRAHDGLRAVAGLVHPGNYGSGTGEVFTGLSRGGLVRLELCGEQVHVYLSVAREPDRHRRKASPAHAAEPHPVDLARQQQRRQGQDFASQTTSADGVIAPPWTEEGMGRTGRGSAQRLARAASRVG